MFENNVMQNCVLIRKFNLLGKSNRDEVNRIRNVEKLNLENLLIKKKFMLLKQKPTEIFFLSFIHFFAIIDQFGTY